eukprot:392255_1
MAYIIGYKIITTHPTLFHDGIDAFNGILKRQFDVICINISSIYSRHNDGIISTVNGYTSCAIYGTFAIRIYGIISGVNNDFPTMVPMLMMQLFQDILLIYHVVLRELFQALMMRVFQDIRIELFQDFLLIFQELLMKIFQDLMMELFQVNNDISTANDKIIFKTLDSIISKVYGHIFQEEASLSQIKNTNEFTQI